jgi:DNA-binding LytR/AlgR family response regulator
MRCHRSYAVNLALVELSTGNAGGLKLMMKPLDVTIPVSRSYVGTIKQALPLVPKLVNHPNILLIPFILAYP